MSGKHNKKFQDDPVDYLNKNFVNSCAMVMDGFSNSEILQPRDTVYLNLVEKSGEVIPHLSKTPKSHGTILKGHYVPYVSEGLLSTTPMGVHEIPNGTDPLYIFTGAVQGCSLVIATKAGRRYAIHDPNSGDAKNGFARLTRDGYQIQKSVNYYNLRRGNTGFYGTEIGADEVALAKAQGDASGWFNGFGLWKYHNGSWSIILQPQFMHQKVTSKAFKVVGKRMGNTIVV